MLYYYVYTTPENNIKDFDKLTYFCVFSAKSIQYRSLIATPKFLVVVFLHPVQR